ncbi:MAG: chemotaxis protein CheW [Archangium sp.]
MAGDISQFLTFTLGNEAFALDILKVQEIKSWVAITPLPNTSPDVRGVINLRGAVVPVVDLRRRFSMPDAELTKYSVIIVARVAEKTVGLLVDAVSDVLDVAADQNRASSAPRDRARQHRVPRRPGSRWREAVGAPRHRTRSWGGTGPRGRVNRTWTSRSSPMPIFRRWPA